MKRFFFLSFIFVFALTSNTSADLISSESFDYSSGIEIKTLGGGVGWSQDWDIIEKDWQIQQRLSLRLGQSCNSLT